MVIIILFIAFAWLTLGLLGYSITAAFLKRRFGEEDLCEDIRILIIYGPFAIIAAIGFCITKEDNLNFLTKPLKL